MDRKLSKSLIAKKHEVSNSTITNIAREHTDDDTYKFNKDRLIKKGANYSIRVTTYIKGTKKSKFINDCLDKNLNESDMANHIFETYYFLQDSIHNFGKIAPNKIKTFLIERIKL